MAVFANIGVSSPYLFAGEDCTFTVLVTADGTSGGTPVNVTGWNGNFIVAKFPGGATLLTVAFSVSNGAGGLLSVTLTAAQTGTTLGAGLFSGCRVERTDAASDTVVVDGNLLLRTR